MVGEDLLHSPLVGDIGDNLGRVQFRVGPGDLDSPIPPKVKFLDA